MNKINIEVLLCSLNNLYLQCISMEERRRANKLCATEYVIYFAVINDVLLFFPSPYIIVIGSVVRQIVSGYNGVNGVHLSTVNWQAGSKMPNAGVIISVHE